MDCTRNGRCSWPSSFISSPSVSSVYLFSLLSFIGKYSLSLSLSVGKHDPNEVGVKCGLISFDKESEEGWCDGKEGVTKGQVTEGHVCKDHKICPGFIFIFFFLCLFIAGAQQGTHTPRGKKPLAPLGFF